MGSRAGDSRRRFGNLIVSCFLVVPTSLLLSPILSEKPRCGCVTLAVCVLGGGGAGPGERTKTARDGAVIGGTQKVSIREVCASGLISFISGLEVI